MKFVFLSFSLAFCLLQENYVCAHRRKHTPRPLSLGDGINFPRRPLSKTTAESLVFGRKFFNIYRTSNPPYNETYLRDGEVTLESIPDGMNFKWIARFDGICAGGDFFFDSISEEGNRAVYTSVDPLPTTGARSTITLFSSHPQDYVFYFHCLNIGKVSIRRGRRVYCDAPWEIAFNTYEFPPNRVKWCAAEKDLCNVMGISFDNEFNRFELTDLDRCPDN